jgi:hypothetical protein
MELCGHASIVTTQGYIHAAEGAAGDAVKVLDRPVAVSTTLQDRGEIVETPIAKSANH